MAVMIIGGTFAAIILICLFWITLDISMDVGRKQYLQLKFSQFKKFYAINPSSYKLHDYIASKNGVCVIKFNFIDTLRYIHFKKQIERNEHDIYMRGKMNEYLRIVQHDIDELNQKAQEEIEKAKREAGRIE